MLDLDRFGELHVVHGHVAYGDGAEHCLDLLRVTLDLEYVLGEMATQKVAHLIDVVRMEFGDFGRRGEGRYGIEFRPGLTHA